MTNPELEQFILTNELIQAIGLPNKEDDAIEGQAEEKATMILEVICNNFMTDRGELISKEEVISELLQSELPDLKIFGLHIVDTLFPSEDDDEDFDQFIIQLFVREKIANLDPLFVFDCIKQFCEPLDDLPSYLNQLIEQLNEGLDRKIDADDDDSENENSYETCMSELAELVASKVTIQHMKFYIELCKNVLVLDGEKCVTFATEFLIRIINQTSTDGLNIIRTTFQGKEDVLTAYLPQNLVSKVLPNGVANQTHPSKKKQKPDSTNDTQQLPSKNLNDSYLEVLSELILQENESYKTQTASESLIQLMQPYNQLNSEIEILTKQINIIYPILELIFKANLNHYSKPYLQKLIIALKAAMTKQIADLKDDDDDDDDDEIPVYRNLNAKIKFLDTLLQPQVLEPEKKKNKHNNYNDNNNNNNNNASTAFKVTAPDEPIETSATSFKSNNVTAWTQVQQHCKIVLDTYLVDSKLNFALNPEHTNSFLGAVAQALNTHQGMQTHTAQSLLKTLMLEGFDETDEMRDILASMISAEYKVEIQMIEINYGTRIHSIARVGKEFEPLIDAAKRLACFSNPNTIHIVKEKENYFALLPSKMNKLSI